MTKDHHESLSPATQKDLQELQLQFDARMDQMEEHIMNRFDVLMENLVYDFRGAHKDKIALQDDKLNDHEDRLILLERGRALPRA